MEDGSERPVAYASPTLSTAERNHGHLDKEALAVVFGVKKFHKFCMAAHFKIYTDHKPLLGLLHPEKVTPLMASSKMQRWALTLLAYKYELLYRPGNENGNADGLSRLPVLDVPGSTPVPGDIVYLLETINTSPVDATKIKLWTTRDPVLSQVLQFVLQGWPQDVEEEESLKPYFIRRDELCTCWTPLMGSSGHSTPQRERKGIEHITRYSPGNSQNEEFSQKLCMVAKNGHEFRREGETLCYLSESPKEPSLFAITPFGMAGPPLVANARRLCGTFHGKDVLADH